MNSKYFCQKFGPGPQLLGSRIKNGLAFLSSKNRLNEVALSTFYIILFDELANLRNLMSNFIGWSTGLYNQGTVEGRSLHLDNFSVEKC